MLIRRKQALKRPDRRTIVTAVLQRLGVSIETLHTDVGRVLGVIPETNTIDEIPFTPHARRALEMAIEEARQLGHDHVTPTHLLIGLLKEGQSKASKIVEAFGVDAGSVRRELVVVRQFLGSAVRGTPSRLRRGRR